MVVHFFATASLVLRSRWSCGSCAARATVASMKCSSLCGASAKSCRGVRRRRARQKQSCYLRAWVRACVRECGACVRACACVCACVHACVPCVTRRCGGVAVATLLPDVLEGGLVRRLSVTHHACVARATCGCNQAMSLHSISECALVALVVCPSTPLSPNPYICIVGSNGQYDYGVSIVSPAHYVASLEPEKLAQLKELGVHVQVRRTHSRCSCAGGD